MNVTVAVSETSSLPLLVSVVVVERLCDLEGNSVADSLKVTVVLSEIVVELSLWRDSEQVNVSVLV